MFKVTASRIVEIDEVTRIDAPEAEDGVRRITITHGGESTTFVLTRRAKLQKLAPLKIRKPRV